MITKTKTKTPPTAKPSDESWRERRERFLLDAAAVDAFTIEKAAEEEEDEK